MSHYINKLITDNSKSTLFLFIDYLIQNKYKIPTNYKIKCYDSLELEELVFNIIKGRKHYTIDVYEKKGNKYIFSNIDEIVNLFFYFKNIKPNKNYVTWDEIIKEEISFKKLKNLKIINNGESITLDYFSIKPKPKNKIDSTIINIINYHENDYSFYNHLKSSDTKKFDKIKYSFVNIVFQEKLNKLLKIINFLPKQVDKYNLINDMISLYFKSNNSKDEELFKYKNTFENFSKYTKKTIVKMENNKIKSKKEFVDIFKEELNYEKN